MSKFPLVECYCWTYYFCRSWARANPTILLLVERLAEPRPSSVRKKVERWEGAQAGNKEDLTTNGEHDQPAIDLTQDYIGCYRVSINQAYFQYLVDFSRQSLLCCLFLGYVLILRRKRGAYNEIRSAYLCALYFTAGGRPTRSGVPRECCSHLGKFA